VLAPCLEDIERRIDPDEDNRLRNAWVEFIEGRFTGSIFSPKRDRPRPPRFAWPEVRINDTLEDFKKMALRELAAASRTLAAGSGTLLNVRANYGTGILPSIFGAELFRMDDALDTLPTTRPLEGSADAIRALLDCGAPEITAGLGGRALETSARFVQTFAPYPNLRRYLHVYHPDLQGPIDVCEMLWGSEIFLALVDEPELVKALLELVTGTYLRFMCEWERLVPPPADGFSRHWGLLHRGRIMLRDDSAMNLSPAMFDEFARPYDQRLLDEFGGGCLHFCGRGDHFIASACQMRSLHGIQLSQPECNDMEAIYRATVDRGIPLLGLRREAAGEALGCGRDLRGLVHCRT